jgi:DNA-binding transcriptional regulator YhcF (GntR family)
MLVKASSVSLTEQLVQLIASRIQSHLMSPGSKLPSVRQCAQQHQLSPSTVVAAYDRLQAQGWIEARKNRGFFVREVLKNEAISATSTSNSHTPDLSSSSGAAVARHHQAP